MAFKFYNTGFNEPIVQGKAFPNVLGEGNYAYRERSGLIPSKEFSVFMDDFYLNPSTNALPGTTAVIDTGATIVAAATDAISYHGALKFASDGTTEGAALYWPKGIQLGLGKKFFMEARMYTVDADDTDLIFGLSDLTATTNPEDLWTTTAANVVAFGVLDGDATVSLLCDKDNAGAAADLGTYDLSDATWHVLGIEIGGTAAGSNMYCKGYVDGKLAVTFDTETAIPDDLALAPFIGFRTGGDLAHVGYFDYLRWSLER